MAIPITINLELKNCIECGVPYGVISTKYSLASCPICSGKKLINKNNEMDSLDRRIYALKGVITKLKGKK